MKRAYNWDDVLDEALAAGVDCFIAKPIFTKNILDELKNILKKKRQHIAPMKRKAELSGRQLLLAEDMEVNAQIMIEILKMRNIQTDHAENGKIALEMFSKSPIGYYDAILMDMRMPEMDGLEATAAIRKLDRPDAKVIPIIALTAHSHLHTQFLQSYLTERFVCFTFVSLQCRPFLDTLLYIKVFINRECQ